MIAAVIPTRYYPPTLAPLLEVLIGDGVYPIVVPDIGEREPGWSIYGLWNRGVSWAREIGAEIIVVMNDDITIEPGACQTLARTLTDGGGRIGVVYPDARPDARTRAVGVEDTEGTWGAGGMTGFCFMFRADLPVRFDTGYRWWYGDDQFEADVRAAGLRVCRVAGVPILHTPASSAVRAMQELGPMIAADRARWGTR